MAEKELRRDLHETVREILEVKAELARRILPAKGWARTAVLALFGLIGAKVAFKLVRIVLGVLWGNKLLISVIMLLILSRKMSTVQT
jgi:hypothetical protein